MAAALTEGALDLSKTSDSRPDSKASSPAPSLSSEADSQQTLDRPDRSESVPSDGNETDTSTGPAVKPISSFMASAHLSGDILGQAGMMPASLRPFKMYPMEPMSSMYSPMPTAALSPEFGLSQLSPGATLGHIGLMDANMGLTCSPIAQYIQQRKRRAERGLPSSPDDHDPDHDLDSKKTKIVPEEQKDEHYWERRRKNNDAAKRSRDARRRKEEEIALRAAFLEQENLKLRAQVAILKNETAKLHYMLYNRM